MKLILIAIFVLTSCSGIKPKSENLPVWEYEITYHQSPLPLLEIKMSFQGEADGKTEVRLPLKWAGQKEFYRAVKELKVVNSKAKLIATNEPHIYEVEHEANEQLTISYVLFEDRVGKITGDNRYRPMIRKDYFHIIGYPLFAYTDSDWNKKRKIRLNWNLPRGWNVANSFTVNSTKQEFTTTLKDLKHSIYVAGDFSIKKINIKNYPVYVVIRGNWKFDLDKFYSLIEKSMNIQRGFFNDYHYPQYLITMTPTDVPCCSTGGTGLTNSFSLFISYDLDNTNRFTHLLPHELFHNWNGRVIKREDPEELVYWFSEGFTNYFTRLLNLRGGIISFPDYVTDFNETIERYYTSSARNKSNKIVLKEFWSDKDVGRIPYQRGDLLAHKWNLEMKKNTSKGSISKMFLDLYKEAREKDTVVSKENIQRLSKKYLKNGVKKDIETYIEKAQTIKLDDQTLGPCANLKWRTSYKSLLGFDYAKSKEAKRVKGLIKSSDAYKMGIRNGQEILGRNIYSDINKKSSLTVKMEKTGEEKEIFFSTKGNAIKIPQFEIDMKKYKENPNKCLAFFND